MLAIGIGTIQGDSPPFFTTTLLCYCDTAERILRKSIQERNTEEEEEEGLVAFLILIIIDYDDDPTKDPKREGRWKAREEWDSVAFTSSSSITHHNN